MPNLGEAKLTLRVAGEKFKKGIAAAKGQTDKFGTAAEKSANKAKTAFGNMASSARNAAGRIPVVGGALSGLATPAGAATAVIGLAVGALAKMVTKTLDLGRNLGEAREKLNVSAEAIQIWRRAIEETNGKATAFDDTVLRLQRSIGEAGAGNKAYSDDFEAIGLSWQDLETMSPEDALLAVLSATNDNLNASDGAAVKAGLLGRSYADMGGLANDSGADIRKMLASVEESAVVMGGDAVSSVDEYDAAMREMRDTFGKIAIAIGTKVIPKITAVIKGIGAMYTAVSPVLTPALKILGGVLEHFLINPLKILKGAVMAVGDVLRGDFAGAWNTVKETAVSALSGIVSIYNETIARIPGVAKIDMDNIRDALGVVSKEAEDNLNPALEDTKEIIEDTTKPTKKLTAATDELAESHETAEDRVQKTRKAIEASKKAADSAEDAISGEMLPTLAELIEKLEEEEEAQRLVETAWEDLGPVTDTISRQIKLDEERKTKAAEDHVIALDAASADAVKAHEEQEEAVKDAAKAAEQAAEDMAKAAKKIADDAERETARMVASWNTFKVKQDDTVKAMDENGITFGDAVGLMATDLGISTDDMIADLIGLGVTFGDTMGLMEAVGRANLDKVIAKFAETAAAAADTATATAAAATVVEQSFGQMAMATGASPEVLAAAFGSGGGADPAAAGTTDYFKGKYDHIGGVAGHEARQADQRASAARAFAEQAKGNFQTSYDPVIYGAAYRQLDAAARAHRLHQEIADLTSTVSVPDDGYDNPLYNPDAPATATGGIVNTPQVRLVGEAGPEAIIPLSQTAAMLGRAGGGGGGTTVVVQGSIIDTEGLVQAVGEGTVQLDRRGRQRVLGR